MWCDIEYSWEYKPKFTNNLPSHIVAGGSEGYTEPIVLATYLETSLYQYFTAG